jgi:hypothetical protein
MAADPGAARHGERMASLISTTDAQAIARQPARNPTGRAPKRSRWVGAYAGGMSESAAELPADDAPLARAADDARRGVATHLTINGVRVAVIMPEGVIEALRDFAAMLTDERIATYLPTLLPRAMPWTRSLPESDVPAFVADLAAAAAGGNDAPEKVAAVIREWQTTAEIYGDPREVTRLRQAMQEAREGKATPWEYDDAE